MTNKKAGTLFVCKGLPTKKAPTFIRFYPAAEARHLFKVPFSSSIYQIMTNKKAGTLFVCKGLPTKKAPTFIRFYPAAEARHLFNYRKIIAQVYIFVKKYQNLI